jgi:hypothetical protein
MGERVAVKKGSLFERTNSQKKQLALQTENSTVGISLFQDMSSTDSALLGGGPHGDPHGDPHGRGQSEEELSSGAFARQQAGGGDGVAGGGLGSEPGDQWGRGGGQEPAGGGQQQQQPGNQEGVSRSILPALLCICWHFCWHLVSMSPACAQAVSLAVQCKLLFVMLYVLMRRYAALACHWHRGQHWTCNVAYIVVQRSSRVE